MAAEAWLDATLFEKYITVQTLRSIIRSIKGVYSKLGIVDFNYVQNHCLKTQSPQQCTVQ